jgi:hypothetical protein
MNPIQIENINNIADIYILRRKMNKSMLYMWTPTLFIIIHTPLFNLLGGKDFEPNFLIEEISFLVMLFFLLSLVVILIMCILTIIVTINAMNKAIAFFTSINEQQYLEKCKFQKKIYILNLFLPILFIIPIISILAKLLYLIIPLINLVAWGRIKDKLKVIEYDFFKKVSK